MNYKYISLHVYLYRMDQPKERNSAVWEDPHIQNSNYFKEDKTTTQGSQNLRKPDLYKYCENSREMMMLTWMTACPPHVIIQLNPLYMT